jgi:hypothetical protein
MSQPDQKKPNPEVLGLIPRPVFLPDEDPLAYEALHGALMGELAPGTPYERVLAANLALLEWDAIRHRRLRDNLLLLAVDKIVPSSKALARAYANEITTIVVHDDRLEEIENRRRWLRDDLDRLKAQRKRAADSVTVIEA